MQHDKRELSLVSNDTVSRKDSHIELALQAQNENIDQRFYYEPLMNAHPQRDEKWPVSLADKSMDFPLWISSMTGGTLKANEINKRLAHTVKNYGLGMGVGSARIALEDSSKVNDFKLRPLLGDAAPFYLNFGIVQIEKYLQKKEIYKMLNLREELNADGFIIHVNPLQEWMQPEGDRLTQAPIDIITRFMNETDAPLMVKEVGQGFGPESMKALLQLPLAAIEFGAAGGTNFSKVEHMRSKALYDFPAPLIGVGHSAEEMVAFLNTLIRQLGNKLQCHTAIISGGVKDFLDGYYFIQKSSMNALYGQASQFLKYAIQSQEALDAFAKNQTEGLIMARSFLKIKA